MMRYDTSESTVVVKSTAPAGDEVKEHDVMCGRDKHVHSHSGNKRFRFLIQTNRERYQSAKSRSEKSNITQEILRAIQENGGQFLKIDPATGVWAALDAAEAHEKISHALRSAKDRKVPSKPRKRRQPRKAESFLDEDIFMKVFARQKEILGKLASDSESNNIDDAVEDNGYDTTSMFSEDSQPLTDALTDVDNIAISCTQSNGVATESVGLVELCRSDTMVSFLTDMYPFDAEKKSTL